MVNFEVTATFLPQLFKLILSSDLFLVLRVIQNNYFPHILNDAYFTSFQVLYISFYVPCYPELSLSPPLHDCPQTNPASQEPPR